MYFLSHAILIFMLESARPYLFTFFIFNCIKWHLWFFNVLILCERSPANAMPNKSRSMKWTQFMEITLNTLFFFFFFFFCPVWAQIFWWTQRNTFWISLLKAGNLASSEVGGNLIISNQQKYIWRKPGQKVTLQSKSERSLIACVQQKWIWEHTFLLEFVWKKLHGLEVRSLEPWDIDSGVHAYNLRNRSVLCRNDLCLPASSILKH